MPTRSPPRTEHGDHGVAEPPRPRLGRRPKVGGEGIPEVFCADEQHDVDVDLPRWQRLALDVITDQGVRGLAEMTLLFIGEIDMAELNTEHMNADGPTDVLSFPIDASDAEIILDGEPPSRGPDRPPIDLGEIPLLLGDVVICPAVAARNAPTHAGTLEDELALLVVHGVLHVLGMDHADDDERAAMRAAERRLLETYHWHGPAPAAFRQEQPE